VIAMPYRPFWLNLRGGYKKFILLVGVPVVALVLLVYESPFGIVYSKSGEWKEKVVHANDGRVLRILLWEGADFRSAKGTRTGIIFVHGNTRRGPFEPPYTMLCESLARHGFLVVAPVLRGYDSLNASPVKEGFHPSIWNPLPDIEGAYKFLRNRSEIDPKSIVVVGHSSGGGYALLFGLQEPRVAGVVSISRLHLEERIRTRPGYLEELKASISQRYGLHTPIQTKDLQEFVHAKIFAFEQAKKAMKESPHPRTLLAMGSLERSADRQWLASYAADVAGKTEYYEFQGLTHMLNFWSYGEDLWFYDLNGVNTVAGMLARWIRGQSLET